MPQAYNLQGDALYANPYPLYQRLRSDHPVHLDTSLGCWVVTAYRDVALALSNRSLSSERFMSATAFKDESWQKLAPLLVYVSNLMFFADPPKHTRLRSLVSKIFSAHMIETWRGHIQRVVDERLDLVYEKRQMDVIRDIALPLLIQVIADMFGIPANDQPQFKRWSDDLAEFLGMPPTLKLYTRLMQSIEEFMAYFRSIVAQRRDQRHRSTHQQEDLIDVLILARDHADALSEDELLVNCIGLFAGGHETTTNLIGNGLLALLRNRAELQKLQNNPQLIVSAVEECLRYDSPVQFTARKALEHISIRGKKISKGQSVLLMLGAANRDPDQFHDPDRFDISRQENRHLAFGHNIHYCVGAALGRLEAQIAINTILRRMPELQLTPQPLRWQENLSFHGVKELLVSF
ncbi:MAG: cytochrome P450 [Chloroflexi bacterium]|nr:MAG: cytochrome P450 [Chloroflexota bacterium]